MYNLGHYWGDKKVICNKFEQNSSITAMIWPNKKSHEIFFGIADGKVKMGMLKNNSAQVLYSTNSFVLTLSCNSANTTLISGHMNLTIYCHSFETGTLRKISSMPSISYCLSYLVNDQYLLATLDKKVYICSPENGKIEQIFDYSKKENLKDFTICKVNSTYEMVALANYDKIFIYTYNIKLKKWEESCIVNIENYYSITALCWKQDFGILITGSLCGSLDMFESCIKKSIIGDNFELTYISLSQIIIMDTEKAKRMMIKTNLSN